MQFRITILTFWFIIASISLKAQQQDSSTQWFPEIRITGGFVVDHSNSMAFAIQKPVKSFQLNYLRTGGHKHWHQNYGFPITGFGYYFVDLGNPKVLGRAHSIFGIVNFPLHRRPHFSINFNSGIGLSYFTTYFDVQNNIYNSAMGSHFNSFFDFSLDLQIHAFKHFWLGQSFGLTHSSNGRTNTPNLGINLLTFRLAIRKANYYAFPKQQTFQTDENNQARWMFNAIASGGIRERSYPGGTKYFVHSFMINGNKKTGKLGGINLGFDFFHDSSISQIYEANNAAEQNYFSKTYSGAHIGLNLMFDSFWVILQQGFKLHNNEPGSEFLYQRLGLNYLLKEHLIFNFALKTYFAKAEFVELGLGYRLDFK